ncbi:MAG: hypothetical protein M5T61_07015 [Acidimicrobiia bacterium]|nr:hypothetical protein [Acidimicrobiia bacterium]
MSLILIVIVMAIGSWTIGAVWNGPDNLQFLAPIVMTVYSAMVIVPLSAIVILTRRVRRKSGVAESSINMVVTGFAVIGAATWLWVIVWQTQELILRT